MLAMEHFGVIPDIMALAKGIASGMPLGALVARGEIMDWEAGFHASTFGGNPVSCRVALATIDLLIESLMANAALQGDHLINGLRKLRQSHECMGDVRGKDLMVDMELVEDRETKVPAKECRDKIINAAFRKGLPLWVVVKTIFGFARHLR